MPRQFVLIPMFLAFASALALGQANIPPSRPAPADIPSSTQAPGEGLPQQGNPVCSQQCLRAQLEVTSQVLKMLLDADSFQQFIQNEDTQDPQAQLKKRMDIIRQFIQGLKANASQ